MTANNITAMTLANALPALSGSSITYNAAKNVFLANGYTSAAGNTYYQALRCNERIIIRYDIGEGYAHTFLNGITLFCWNGRKAELIAQKRWGGCDNWRAFSEPFAKRECVGMLVNFLRGQFKLEGKRVSENALEDFSRGLIDNAMRKRLT